MPKATKPPQKNPPQSPKPNQRQRVESIMRRRERLIVEAQVLSTVEGCAVSAKKAQQLLTRWWAKADWKAREELLRVAEWIIHVEAIGAA